MHCFWLEAHFHAALLLLNVHDNGFSKKKKCWTWGFSKLSQMSCCRSCGLASTSTCFYPPPTPSTCQTRFNALGPNKKATVGGVCTSSRDLKSRWNMRPSPHFPHTPGKTLGVCQRFSPPKNLVLRAGQEQMTLVQTTILNTMCGVDIRRVASNGLCWIARSMFSLCREVGDSIRAYSVAKFEQSYYKFPEEKQTEVSCVMFALYSICGSGAWCHVMCFCGENVMGCFTVEHARNFRPSQYSSCTPVPL